MHYAANQIAWGTVAYRLFGGHHYWERYIYLSCSLILKHLSLIYMSLTCYLDPYHCYPHVYILVWRLLERLSHRNLTCNSCFCSHLNDSLLQCVPLEGSPGKCWFTSACHACTKCGCHRRKWPPVCSVLTWLVTAVWKNMGPIIRRW
jgi:hypothetical protein